MMPSLLKVEFNRPINSTSGYISKRTEGRVSKNHLCTHVIDSDIISNSQKVDVT